MDDLSFLNDIYNGNTDMDMLIASPYANSSINALTPTQSLFVGSFLIIWLVIVLAIGVLSIIGLWKVFKKAGEKGWKSIIPIYNLIILYKISGLSPLLLLIFLVGLIPILGWFLLPIATLVLQIVLAIKLANSFGKGSGYIVGLIFLPTIFYLILGFGNSKYIGPDGEQQTIDKTSDTPTQDSKNRVEDNS